jgi:hypothetical protein
VTRGQVIGHLAAGTHCPASCLHWGVRNPNRVYVNPLVLVTGRVRLWPVYTNELRTNVARNAPMGRLRRAGEPVRRPPVVARP